VSAAELELVGVTAVCLACLCGSGGDGRGAALDGLFRLTEGGTTMRDEWLLTNCASAVTLALLRQLAAVVELLLGAIAANCRPRSRA
jgi:hypothetical protein